MRAKLAGGIACVGALAFCHPAPAVERPILDGRWDTVFTTPQRTNVDTSKSERRWVFRRRMNSKGCRLTLLYELALGGFDRVCLHRRGDRYRGRTVSNRVPCGRGYEPGRTVERFTVRVIGSEWIDGYRYATRLEAYYRATYRSGKPSRCQSTAREVRHYTGERVDVP